MLVLRRRDGQRVEIAHRSGDVIRIRVYGVRRDGHQARLNMAFDDDARNFEVSRPERQPWEAGHADRPAG